MPQNTKPTFEEIYKALKNNKPADIEEKLRPWLSEYASKKLINTSKYDDMDIKNVKSDTPFTVAAQLAMDGQHELVDELITKHGAMPASVLMGYAMANQVEEVDKRIERSRTLDKETLVLAALEGYIVSGNQQAVKEFIRKHDDQIKSRLEPLYQNRTINTLISAAVLNSQSELFESILKPYLIKNSNEEQIKQINLNFYFSSIYYFAIKKDKANVLSHYKKLEEHFSLIAKDKIANPNTTEEDSKKGLNNIIISVFTLLDDKQLFQTFCKERLISEEDILQAFGNNDFPFLEDLKKTEIYRQYHIDAILNHYKEQRSSEKDADGKIKSYHYFGLFQFFSNSFSFKQKEDAYETLERVVTHNIFNDGQGSPIDLLQHKAALRNGRLGESLRAFIKAGRADKLLAELAGNGNAESNSEYSADALKTESSAQTQSKFKVRTVSEFVDALQAIISEKEPAKENVGRMAQKAL